MRDTGSHQRVFTTLWSVVDLVDHAACGSESLREPYSGGSASVWGFCVGFVSQVMRVCVKLKKLQIKCHMEYLFTKGYGIIFLCLFQP